MPVADALAAACAAAAESTGVGAIPFDAFVEFALYGPGGFYTAGGTAGRRGDFITSAEVGPLFGAVLGSALHAEWQRLGEPDDFTVIEVGAGPGTLARAVLAAAGPWLARYVAVELSDAQRARHLTGDVVQSSATLPPGPLRGVVLANELLDNLPFRLAVFDGAWREAYVTVGADGRPVEVLSAPLDPIPAFLPATAPHGARVPLQDRAAAWVRSALATLVEGRVVAFDYCTARTADLAVQPWRTWLRTYRAHARGGHYLADAGAQDVTAQVCIDQLPEPDVVRTQAMYLQRWGIDELVAEGRAIWASSAAAPTLAALRMRSRISESEALLDPAGLGSFTVLEWTAPTRSDAAAP